ncbi:MAG: leucine-rich repeat domain-containing protein, partial [Muribaculaceae bacterium]
MIARIQLSLRKSAWLLALLIITSALPARAYYDEFYEDDLGWQEWLFKFDYSDDLNGYIVSPNKDGVGGDQPWLGNAPFLLEVPSIYLKNGKPVVGLSGFGSLTNLVQIIFPEDCHVKYICDNCFQYCYQLGADEQVLNLPESVETIGHYAFYGCTGLQSVNLSSNLNSIGVGAFKYCYQLRSITLPKSLTEIREWAFQDCTGLESVVFEDGVDFWNNGVYCFYNNVFWGCANLSSVTLPKGTPGRFIIPQGTFGYCGNLKSIEFPSNTSKIEQMAFYRSGLEILDLTKIELEEDKPFYLTGYYTFAACENLTTVKAKGKVQFTGLYTFQECTALETVTFTGSGEDYTVMNPDIFKRCSNLQTVKFYRLKGNGQDNDMDSVFTDCKSLVSVTSECTPEISKIGYSCFDGCEKLTTLSLPQTEYLINETAFRGCTSLKSFDFTNVTSIGKATFSGCTGLTSLDFTDLTSIGTEAFKDCTALTSVNFNTSSQTSFASTIGSLAFTGCTALESLNFNSSLYDPPTVESEDAFDASHYNLTKVNMP